MSSHSLLALMWMFGTWIFSDGELSANVAAQTVTPLTIFASSFATVGLAMFGLLGGWAVFLGIFRLKNNGNFFGARDGNESFFYPLRMVFSMILCAPLIPIASAGGEPVTLTPGHALVAGLSKSATEFGDHAQSHAFRLMHRYNLFNDPQFEVKVAPQKALDMINSWKQSAAQLAGLAVFQDGHGRLKEVSPAQLANEVLRIRWNQVHPNHPAVLSLSGEAVAFLSLAMRSRYVPVIAPSDQLARAVATGIDSVVASDAAEGTVERELESEGWLCQVGWMTSTFCSDEYQAVQRNNTASIQVGIASAQRDIWANLVGVAVEQAHAVVSDGVSPEVAKEFFDRSVTWTHQTAAWYAASVEETIKNTLASDQAARAEPYFDEVKNWGWMLGGTFASRIASDFTRAASYAEGATSMMMPKSSLAAMTPGADLSTLIEQESLAQIQPGAMSSEKSMYADIFSLDILKSTTGPDAQNIHNVASWGRAMVGTGMGLWVGGGIAKYIPGLKSTTDGGLIKAIGVLLIILGGLIGHVMPALFSIHGLMGAISWLVAVATTFFGITLWSAGMAAPKGEEHTSQLSAKGWNALIFIGLYPALAVGGLAAAITISAVGLSVVVHFGVGLLGMSDPGVAEAGRPLESLGGILIGGLLLVIVVGLISLSVVVTSAQLITTFPRTVLNMIALSEPGLNPYDNASQGIMGGLSMSGRQMLTGAASRVIGRQVGRINRSVGDTAGGS
jgi:hypothetical protein